MGTANNLVEYIKKHGSPSNCRQAAPAVIKKYQNQLPALLIDLWQQQGWCSYGQGLIWLVNPEDFKDLIVDWLGSDKKAVVFARTAFGQMFVWLEEKAQFVDVHYSTIAPITKKIEILFNYTLCQDSYLEKVLDKELFDEVLPKLGPLNYDQCYGFVPALALGGPGTADTVQKLKLREHLAILAQLKE